MWIDAPMDDCMRLGWWVSVDMVLNGRLYETGLVGVVWIDAPQWTTVK